MNKFVCPSCDSQRTTVTQSRLLKPDVRERYYQCNNPECTAVFRTQERIVGAVDSASISRKNHNGLGSGVKRKLSHQ